MKEITEEEYKIFMLLKQLHCDKLPDVPFICGMGGEKDLNGLPEIIMLCPSYGSDHIKAYKKVN
jgi:hypothetical protein